MTIDKEILEELKILNIKMDQLIIAINHSKVNSMPAFPQMPSTNPGAMPLNPNLAQMPSIPNIEDIKKTVEERVKKARESMDLKINKAIEDK